MILITSAQYCGRDIEDVFGRIPPVFLPAGNEFLLEKQLRALKSGFPGEEIYLTLPNDYAISAFQAQIISEYGVSIILLDPSLTLCMSLLNVITAGHNVRGPLRVLHGDTYIHVFSQHYDSLALATSSSRYYYYSGDALVWCGFFSFSDLRVLQQALQSGTKFEDAVHEYSLTHSLHEYCVDEWVDFGNYHSFEQGRLQFLESRYFNDVSADRYEVYKRSKDSVKVANEFKWFKSVPPSLKKYMPNVWQDDAEDGYYLERACGVPVNQWLTCAAEHSVSIDGLLSELGGYLEAAKNGFKFEAGLLPREASIEHLSLQKSLSRIREIDSRILHAVSDISDKTVTQDYLNKLVEHCYDICVANTVEEPGLLHGDLCASNIIFDFGRKRLRLIDPRGGNVYGDLRYDLAKLHHSLFGGYDHILGGMYSYEGTGIKIHNEGLLRVLTCHQWFAEGFFGRDFSAIEKLSATLFISMIPLHQDDENRQIALLSRGLQLAEA